MKSEKLRTPKPSMALMMFMAEDKAQKQKEKAELPLIREGVLTGLLMDVADAYGVPFKTIISSDRQELTVFARSIYYFVARLKTDYGMVAIVKVAGRTDHASLIHQLKKIQGYLRARDPEWLALWNYYLENSKLFTPKDFQ